MTTDTHTDLEKVEFKKNEEGHLVDATELEACLREMQEATCSDVPWHKLDLWQGWATRLDNTDFWYIRPDEYALLQKQTKQQPPFLEARCS